MTGAYTQRSKSGKVADSNEIQSEMHRDMHFEMVMKSARCHTGGNLEKHRNTGIQV